MITALTIAGSDPTGAAGVEVDLRVMQAMGVHGLSVATALTTQNSVKVASVEVLKPELVEKRLRFLIDDMKPKAIKCGMLGDASIVDVVANVLSCGLGEIPFVLDPVILSSSGKELLDERGLDFLREKLVPRATIITPNRQEAARLLNVGSGESAETMARELSLLGPIAVVTGGDAGEPSVISFVGDNGAVSRLESERIGSYSPHGTGCMFSAALVAGLAQGSSFAESIDKAQKFMTRAIRNAQEVGSNGRLFCQF